MMGLDSNVLLRAITGDDMQHARIARRILARLSPEQSGYINTVVMAELA